MLEHTVKSFDQELQQLDKKIAQMGGLAERLLGQGFDALERRDPKLAEAAVASDRNIDMGQREKGLRGWLHRQGRSQTSERLGGAQGVGDRRYRRRSL